MIIQNFSTTILVKHSLDTSDPFENEEKYLWRKLTHCILHVIVGREDYAMEGRAMNKRNFGNAFERPALISFGERVII